jgi:hypothetical protein
LSQFVEINHEYGIKIAGYGLLWWIGIYIRNLSLTAFMLKRLTRCLDIYFEQHFSEVISSYIRGNVKLNPQTVPVDEYTIWCFWWQGEEGMPFVVKKCYERIKQNNLHVVLVTRDNIKEYVHLPESIYDKVEKGLISSTHLSDILRLTLLAEYGGMWVDVTCFNPYPIPEDVKSWPFYSPCRAEWVLKKKANYYPSDEGGWRSWNLGTNIKNSLLFSFSRDLLQDIAVKKSCMPHYFMIDVVISYAYRKFPEVKRLIDSKPDVNENCAVLFNHYFNPNRIWNEDEYKKLIENDWMFKLSYKTRWLEEVDGKETFYGKLFGHNPEDE